MHVLIAGGAGFIGYHLSKVLLDKGYSVVCIDNLLTGSRDNIKDFLSNSNFQFIEGDITDQNSKLIHSTSFGDSQDKSSGRESQISNLNLIYHLASPASPNKKSKKSYIAYPVETLLANSVGTHNLLELAKKSNSRFVYASSSEVYGNPSVSPQPETYFGNVNPTGVRSCYDEGKRFGEAMTMAYFRKYNLDARIVRIFNTYGEKMQKDDGRVISNFITQALSGEPITVYGDGGQTRSFCYVSDLVEGLVAFGEKESLSGEIVNLGNPLERTIKEMAELIKKLVNSSSEIVHEEATEDDPKMRKPDIAKVKRLLGFEPKISLEEGLRKTIEYFKKSV